METLKGKICKVYDTPLLSHRRDTDGILCDLELFTIFREPLRKYVGQETEGRVWRVHYTYNNITHMRHFSDEDQAIKAQREAVDWNGFFDVGY